MWKLCMNIITRRYDDTTTQHGWFFAFRPNTTGCPNTRYIKPFLGATRKASPTHTLPCTHSHTEMQTRRALRDKRVHMQGMQENTNTLTHAHTYVCVCVSGKKQQANVTCMHAECAECVAMLRNVTRLGGLGVASTDIQRIQGQWNLTYFSRHCKCSRWLSASKFCRRYAETNRQGECFQCAFGMFCPHIQAAAALADTLFDTRYRINYSAKCAT